MGRPKGSKNRPKLDIQYDSGVSKKRKRGSKDLSSKTGKILALPDLKTSKSKKDKHGKKDTDKKRRSKNRDRSSNENSEHSDNYDRVLTVFGKDSKKIRDLMESQEDDSAGLAAQRSLLKMLVDLIPVAEMKYRDDPRQSNAYSMNSLISQLRELLHDIQSTQDRSKVVDTIIYNILQPTMVSLANFVIDNNRQTKNELSELIDARQKRELDGLMNKQAKAIGAYMQAMFNELKERITKELTPE